MLLTAAKLFLHLRRVCRRPGEKARTADLWVAYYRWRGGKADSSSDFKTQPLQGTWHSEETLY